VLLFWIYVVFSVIIRLMFLKEILYIADDVESTVGRMLYLLCCVPWIGDIGVVMAAMWGAFNWAMEGRSLDDEADE
jgi:hypothetical protein